jgi:hypothetical protein
VRASVLRRCQQLRDRVGIDVDQRIRGERRAIELIVSGALQRLQRGTKRFGEADVHGPGDMWMKPGKIGEHCVDAVETGARHQADIKLGERARRGRHVSQMRRGTTAAEA